MAQLLIYEDPIALDRRRYRSLRIKLRVDSFGFARRINSVPLLVSEFAAAARHCPIVFAGSPEKGLMPGAVLGLEDQRNLDGASTGARSTDPEGLTRGGRTPPAGPAATSLQKLSRAGSLGPACVHLMSLGNVESLSLLLDQAGIATAQAMAS